ARARGVPDRGEGGDRAQPDHQGIRGQRHPGAQRALRAVHQRRQAQRPHPQGSRPEVADPRGGHEAARGDRQADARALRAQGRGEEGAGEEGGEENRREEGRHEEDGEEGDRENREKGREENRTESDEEDRREVRGAHALSMGGARASIAEAVAVLRRGGVIAYPTEGVWGLGCDPFDEAAVARLLAMKRRAPDKGVILVGASADQFDGIADWGALPRERVDAVLASWPGPHTWIVPATARVPHW